MASSSHSSTPTLLTLLLLLLGLTNLAAARFTCTGTSPRATCHALIDYISPNATTLSAVKTLFNVKKLNDLLGANNLNLSTPASAAFQRLRVPLPCACANGSGVSNGVPVYTVKRDDGLDHIARDLFGAVITFQEIATANGIQNPDKIEVGQKLKIPIPCSCDAVDGGEVVHYGHVVAPGSSVAAIAATYGVNESTVLRLNGIANASDLLAGQLLDLPLRACSSSVRNESLDSPLLVPNGTYFVTAHQCVNCRCDSANNWTLQCEPSQLKSTQWSSCPSTQCSQNGTSLTIGNRSSNFDACNGTSCAYVGYDNKTIFTSLIEQTCPVSNNNPNNGATKMGARAWNWNFVFVSVHLILITLALF